MRTIRFARLSFERKLSHFTDQRDAIQRRKAALREVIDYDTDVNALLEGTERSGKTDAGQWYFGDVEDEGDYISGTLGKVKERTTKLPDDEKKGFSEEESRDTDVSFFVIDLNTSVMAYEYRRDIGNKAPYRILEAVFNEYHDGEEDISISPLIDKEEMQEELALFQRITRVTFSGLTPPNPHSTDSSRSMHEFLRDTGINNLFLDGRSDNDREDEGIQIEGDPMLDGGMNLAEEGYGSATVHGEDEDGEEKIVTTDEKPIESEVEMTDEDGYNRQILLDEIREALAEQED